MTPPTGPTGDDIFAAAGELQGNLISYKGDLQTEADALEQAGRVDEAFAMQALADQTNEAQANLAYALQQANAQALGQDLAALAGSDTQKLQTVVATIAAQTRALQKEEATVTWVVNLATTMISLVGGASVPSAAGELWTLLTNKPK